MGGGDALSLSLKKKVRERKVKNNCSSCRDPGGPGPSEALTSESRGRRETSLGSSSRAAGSRPGNARACGFNLAAAQKPSSTGAPPALLSAPRRARRGRPPSGGGVRLGLPGLTARKCGGERRARAPGLLGAAQGPRGA